MRSVDGGTKQTGQRGLRWGWCTNYTRMGALMGSSQRVRSDVRREVLPWTSKEVSFNGKHQFCFFYTNNKQRIGPLLGSGVWLMGERCACERTVSGGGARGKQIRKSRPPPEVPEGNPAAS
eukprot:GGOE01011434.1.p3 GENE.GGOE01011434.1~~GGOE01011434.1.p3  ORF type:complete len:121 (-),score=4.92 GGOE01011434.1:54-416(-)